MLCYSYSTDSPQHLRKKKTLIIILIHVNIIFRLNQIFNQMEASGQRSVRLGKIFLDSELWNKKVGWTVVCSDVEIFDDLLQDSRPNAVIRISVNKDRLDCSSSGKN